ncbi:uncharacterized protein CLUP02_03622 [Colletotrichum lupini]|uniref:Uncharacterized protein n=1 Tax=Colletotrichum lupini TaxID=145971 RepID=A0A9Q8SJ63_9PEZI|nr:uncharacterized protein CLUP02_03622 [Colletotrichum lupini]UQC78148.1 hypothetical protein CLUP02_03622 [Colletotrichum lupini]
MTPVIATEELECGRKEANKPIPSTLVAIGHLNAVTTSPTSKDHSDRESQEHVSHSLESPQTINHISLPSGVACRVRVSGAYMPPTSVHLVCTWEAPPESSSALTYWLARRSVPSALSSSHTSLSTWDGESTMARWGVTESGVLGTIVWDVVFQGLAGTANFAYSVFLCNYRLIIPPRFHRSHAHATALWPLDKCLFDWKRDDFWPFLCSLSNPMTQQHYEYGYNNSLTEPAKLPMILSGISSCPVNLSVETIRLRFTSGSQQHVFQSSTAFSSNGRSVLVPESSRAELQILDAKSTFGQVPVAAELTSLPVRERPYCWPRVPQAYLSIRLAWLRYNQYWELLPPCVPWGRKANLHLNHPLNATEKSCKKELANEGHPFATLAAQMLQIYLDVTVPPCFSNIGLFDNGRTGNMRSDPNAAFSLADLFLDVDAADTSPSFNLDSSYLLLEQYGYYLLLSVAEGSPRPGSDKDKRMRCQGPQGRRTNLKHPDQKPSSTLDARSTRAALAPAALLGPDQRTTGFWNASKRNFATAMRSMEIRKRFWTI